MGCGSSSAADVKGPTLPKLTEGDRRCLKDSWAAFKQRNEVAHPTYGVFIFVKMFALSPDAAPLFSFLQGVDLSDADGLAESTRLQVHIGRVTSTIDTAVSNVDDLTSIAPVVVKLGARHKNYGVKPDFFPSVAAGVLYALEKALGADFTEDVQAAWGKLLNTVAALMLSGFNNSST